MKITRSPYGIVKRSRRRALRLLGRWDRRDYDIRIEYANARPIRKHVRCQDRTQADRISANLQRFNGSPHLPVWYRQDGRTVVVEFVDGPTCKPITDAMLPALAQCLGCFHRRDVESVKLTTSRFWQSHLGDIDMLARVGVIDRNLAAALIDYSQAVAPRRLVVGFDYTDPIEANIVQRSDTGHCCAIDIKNVYGGQPIGLGLTKMSHRWLTPARRPLFFSHLPADACNDYVEYFDFLRVFERVQRAARKTDTDIRFARLLTKSSERRDALAGLVPGRGA